MKLKKIKVENVLSYKNETIDFNDDLNIFVGSNGSGKSNLVNIIIYILKKYFFKNYTFSKEGSAELSTSTRYYIYEKSPLYYSSEDTFLKKHKKLRNKESNIKFEICFEDSDLKNIEEIKRHKEKIMDFVFFHLANIEQRDGDNHIRKEDIYNFFDIDISNFKIDVPISIDIKYINNKWEINNKIENDYLTYMNFFMLLLDLINFLGVEHKATNPFVFFEAYRNNDKKTTIVDIGDKNTSSYVNMESVINIQNSMNALGIDSTYIMAATKLFAQKQRKYIETSKGNGLRKFNKDSSYVKLKEYFKKFDYDINLRCIDYYNNIYQYYLVKDKVEVEIDSISSGEREIINFIFGLFLDKVDGNIIVIDEPELHLHPKWQKKLINILKEETKDKNVQIFFVTHSSSFISYEILNNVFRVYMKKGFSKVIKISDINKNSEAFRKNLSVINATNNEKIFFCDNVILVEGITDEILLSTINEREKIIDTDSLEFINMNGKDKYPIFSDVLSKLNVNYYFIGDFDNLNNEEHFKQIPFLEKKFVSNVKEQVKDLRNKSKKNVSLELLDSLKTYFESKTKENEKDLEKKYELFDMYFSDPKGVLSADEEKQLNEYIESLYNINIYLLKLGEIEDYLKTGNSKGKDFEKVIDIYNDIDEYKKYIESGYACELIDILKNINEKINKE